MYLWWIAPLLSFCVFFVINKLKKLTVREGYAGVLLIIIDGLVQNIGRDYGLWSATNSLLMIGGQPVEILPACYFFGVIVSSFFRKNKWLWNMFVVALFSFIGAFAEQVGLMLQMIWYSENWNFLFAFLLYFLCLFGLMLAWNYAPLPELEKVFD